MHSVKCRATINGVQRRNERLIHGLEDGNVGEVLQGVMGIEQWIEDRVQTAIMALESFSSAAMEYTSLCSTSLRRGLRRSPASSVHVACSKSSTRLEGNLSSSASRLRGDIPSIIYAISKTLRHHASYRSTGSPVRQQGVAIVLFARNETNLLCRPCPCEGALYCTQIPSLDSLTAALIQHAPETDKHVLRSGMPVHHRKTTKFPTTQPTPQRHESVGLERDRRRHHRHINSWVRVSLCLPVTPSQSSRALSSARRSITTQAV
jgi:hypothetical protein